MTELARCVQEPADLQVSLRQLSHSARVDSRHMDMEYRIAGIVIVRPILRGRARGIVDKDNAPSGTCHA